MGLFSKLTSRIGGLVTKLAPAASFIPGVGPIASRVMSIGGKALSVARRVPGGVVRAGAIGGGAIATGAAFEGGARLVRGRAPAGAIDPRTGLPFKRRRKAVLSHRDLVGAAKVARVVKSFGYKPKVQRRKHRRGM